MTLREAVALAAMIQLHEEQQERRERAKHTHAWVQCPPPGLPDPIREENLVDYTIEFN